MGLEREKEIILFTIMKGLSPFPLLLLYPSPSPFLPSSPPLPLPSPSPSPLLSLSLFSPGSLPRLLYYLSQSPHCVIVAHILETDIVNLQQHVPRLYPTVCCDRTSTRSRDHHMMCGRSWTYPFITVPT